MDNLPINALDAVFLVVVALSAIVGLSRGFVRETLSLLAWIGAAWIALTFFPDAKLIVQGYIENELFASIIAAAGPFVIALVGLTIIARLIARFVQNNKIVGPTDRLLGLVFGVLRGVVLICLGYLFVLQLITEAETRPEWVENSRLLPHVEAGAELLQGFIPADLKMAGEEGADGSSTSSPDKDGETNYTPDMQESLDRLIEELESESPSQ